MDKLKTHSETNCLSRETLYLECGDGRCTLTVPSLIALFLRQYCTSIHIDIVLVSVRDIPQSVPLEEAVDASESGARVGRDNQGGPRDVNYEFGKRSTRLEMPEGIPYVAATFEHLPRVVQDCHLPCILLQSVQMCVSGLANVLRRIIQVSAFREPHRNLEALLGFRQTCLKCCSESSVWTKLCEVDFPKDISHLLETRDPTETLSIPQCLNKYQELLSQPVATFNSEKLRRKLLKNGNRSGNGGKQKREGGDGQRGQMRSNHGEEQGGETGNRKKADLKSGEKSETSAQGNVTEGMMEKGEGEYKEISIIDGSLTDGNVADVEVHFSGDLSLHTEFRTKLHFCNKKQRRHQKRKQSQKQRESAVQQKDASGEKNCDVEMGRTRRKCSKNAIHKDSLPVLSHSFAQGIDVTLTDFALFLPVHLYVLTSAVNGRLHEACSTIPLVLDWYKRMWDVACVRKVVTACLGMRELDLTLQKDVGTPACLGRAVTNCGSHLSNEDIQAGVGNLSVSRPIIRELLRKVLPGVTVQLEDRGLGAKFSDHPSGITTMDWGSYPSAVSPVEGDLEASRVRKKEQQIESIVSAVQEIATPGSRILDFCSGGGHLGIAVAYCLPECHVIMIDNKEESLRRARGRVQTLALRNVTIYMSNIDYFSGSFDIGVSLHACGVATDIVLNKCLERRASFVCSPCCYGSLHDTHHINYPRSQLFMTSGISKKNYFLLGHAAEQTSWNFESHLAKQGKQCMGLIDRDRAELAREHGYSVTLCSLQPLTCSPKNNLLIGRAPEK